MRCGKLNRKGMALPMVFVFLVISQLVYMGLLRLNQLNMQHYRLFQQHYVASIQLLLAQAHLEYTPQVVAQQWEEATQMILAEQFTNRIGITPFAWLTEESFQAGALQLGESEILVFEQHMEVIEGECDAPILATSELIRQQLEASGYTLVEALQVEDKGQWQADVLPDQHFIFNTGEVWYQASNLLSKAFRSEVSTTERLSAPKCDYLVKWRAFFYRQK